MPGGDALTPTVTPRSNVTADATGGGGDSSSSTEAAAQDEATD